MDPRRTRARPLLTAALPAIFGLSPVVRADFSADQTPFHSYRGMWIDRFDYNGEASIRTAMQRAQAVGVTDVMFQVRGQADAYYYLTEGVEVRHSSVSAGYDPLAIAIDEAHARGLKLHAWINTVPLWNGLSPPSNANHTYNVHPEYRTKSSNGADAPLRDKEYFDSNVARGDVHAHVSAVVGVIARNYAIDGLHLDHTRLHYGNSGANNVIEYPSDPYTVSLFQQQYAGQTPTSHPANYKAFIASRITDLVGSIRQTLKSSRPAAQLSASVWRRSDIGLNDYQQDWARWIDQGLLDAAMPMIYHGSSHTSDFYTPDVIDSLNLRGNAAVMIGLGTYLQTDPATAYANVTYQLNHARNQGANGIQFYDYGTLYNGSAASAEVLRAFQDFFATNSARPAAAGVADFESGEGTFRWNVTLSPSNQNVAGGSADRVTDEKRNGAASQRIVINKTAGAGSFLMRHVSGNPAAGEYASNANFASIGSVGLWLRTSTPDVQVAIALDDTSTGDRSYFMNVIADGQWHKYEWFLNDVSHWDPWVAAGDGKIASRFAVDSIHFIGTESANTIWLDDVFQDAAAVAPNQWTLTSDGSWHNAANWTGGVPNGVGAAANLLRRSTGGARLTLPAGATTKLGVLRFDNAASYEVAGPGSLTMQAAAGAASIAVTNRGAHRISAPMVLSSPLEAFVDRGSTLELAGSLTNTGGRGLTKTGEGTLTFNGAQFHGSGASLSVNRGAVNLDSSGGANLAANVGGGARLNLRADQRLKSLSVSAGASVSITASARLVVVDDLAVDVSGTVDLGEGSVVVHGDSPEADFTGITQLIRNARNGGTWTGTGITSSSIASNRFTTVAAIRNLAADGLSPLMHSFAGESVDADDVLVTYTWTGDLNFDGLVTLGDYAMIDAGYQAGMAGYANGDVNFDGLINGDDYKMIDRAFLRQNRRLAGHSPMQPMSSVPEPSQWTILLLSPLVMRRRRARRAATGERPA